MSANSPITHFAFVDESNWNTGRFRALGAVSLKTDAYTILSGKISKLLEESNVIELKWSKVTDAKYRFAAEKVNNLVIEQAVVGSLRVDVLSWDIEDKRHGIKGRDDIENLHRMYHHLLKNIMKDRWEDDAVWHLKPDEHTALRFEDIHYFLEIKETGVAIEDVSLFSSNPKRYWRKYYNIIGFEPVTSEKEVLVQIADIFAGMVCFSRACYEKYKNWERSNSQQQTLFEYEKKTDQLSKSEKTRFELLKKFNEKCKCRRLGVSLDSCNGLKTFDPSKPINFWWYEPQGDYDKAPTKQR